MIALYLIVTPRSVRAVLSSMILLRHMHNRHCNRMYLGIRDPKVRRCGKKWSVKMDDPNASSPLVEVHLHSTLSQAVQHDLFPFCLVPAFSFHR